MLGRLKMFFMIREHDTQQRKAKGPDIRPPLQKIIDKVTRAFLGCGKRKSCHTCQYQSSCDLRKMVYDELQGKVIVKPKHKQT